MYSSLAKNYDLVFMPNILKDVAGRAKYNLEDGMHPNSEGHKVIAKNIYPIIYPVLNDAKAKPPKKGLFKRLFGGF